MSSASHTNAAKHRIQQKIDELCDLKDQIQRKVDELTNNVIHEARTVLDTNDRKLLRSKYRPMNEQLEVLLLKLLSIRCSLNQNDNGEESCSDSDSDTSVTMNSTPDCSDGNSIVAKMNSAVETSIAATVLSSDAPLDVGLVTSSPLQFVPGCNYQWEIPKTEEASITEIGVTQLENGSIRDEGVSLLVVSDVTAKGHESLEAAASLQKVGEIPPNYDHDFNQLMSRLKGLNNIATCGDAAVRELLAQEVKQFLNNTTDSPRHDTCVAEGTEELTSSDTLVVDTVSNHSNGVAVEVKRPVLRDRLEEIDNLTIKGLKVEVGSELCGIVTHVESPHLFYVRLLDPDTQEMLTENLSEHYDSQYRDQLTEEPWLGMSCCALETAKNTWTRAVVTEIHKCDSNSSKVSVFYVDYGHTEKLSVVRLKKLPESFRQIPRQAIPCCLHAGKPLHRQSEFSREEIEYFKGLFSGSTVIITIRNLGPVRSVDVIQLQNDSDGKPFNFAESLSKAGLVSYENDNELPPLEIPSVKPGTDSDTLPTVQDFLPGHVEQKVAEMEPALPSTSASQLCQKDSSSSQWIPWQSNGLSPVSKACTTETRKEDGINFRLRSLATNPLRHSAPLFDVDSGSSVCEVSAETTDVEVVHDMKIQHRSKQARGIAKGTKDVEFLGQVHIRQMKLNSTKSKFIKGMLSIINSPFDFYMHFATEETTNIDVLHEEMNAVFSNSEAPLLIVDPAQIAIGSYWCCRASIDGKWYRAKILEVRVEESSSSVSPAASVTSDDESDKKKRKRKRRKQKKVASRLPKLLIHVFYIDHGNSEWVNTDSLRMIYKKFCKHPALAVQCKMAHVMPSSTDGNWSRDATKSLESWIDCKVTEIQFFEDIDSIVPGVPLAVYLWDLNDEEGKLLNLELVRHGFATSSVLLLDDASNGNDCEEIKTLETWDPIGEDFRSLRNSYNVDIDDAGVALTGYKARDEQEICLFYQRGQLCPRSLGCRFKHIEPPKDGITTDKKRIPNIYATVTLPLLDSFVAVKVMVVTHPGKFFVNFPFTSEPLAVLKEQKNWTLPSENLYVLDKELQNEYNNLSSKRHGSYLSPALGEIVVAKYSLDGSWYRARVVDFNPYGNEVVVFFVDYGNEETVSTNDIREIQPRFVHLPLQAVECSLSGIKPCNDEAEWSDSAKLKFKKFTNDKKLVAEIVDICFEKLFVVLHTLTSTSSINVNDALVNAEMARYVTDSVHMPSDGSRQSNHSQLSLV